MNRALRVAGLVTPLLASILYASPSFAADSAAAQALFDDAKRLMAADKWVDACPKLEESQRLDPGIGTGYQMASCHEHIGRSATAWAEFLDVAAMAKTAAQPVREKAAREKAAALEPRLSRMTVSIARETPGLKVTRDGGELGRGQWGAAMPIDPGPHTIVARAPGKKTWERNIRILADARTIDVSVPALDDDPAAVAVAPQGAGAVAAPQAATSRVADEPPMTQGDPGKAARVVGITLVGIGLVGLGVGTGFGIMSKSKHDDAQSHCDAANHCDGDGLSLRETAFRDGTISTIAFAAGGAALVTGAIVWLTAPSSRSATTGHLEAAPMIGAASAGISVRSLW